jgi:fimbrial chaperone protein
MTGRLLAGIVTLATFMSAGMTAEAATFTVNPTQIYLSTRVQSALLTVRNESSEALRFQISAFAWEQNPGGDMKLGATQDVVFFPALLTLQPNEERRIRIGSTAAAGSRERTYRIFVEELPPSNAHEPGAAVRVLTRMGIPVFIRPVKEVGTATLAGLSASNGALKFSVANTGTVHIMPERIAVRAKDASGQPLFEMDVPSWYILSDGRREFDVPLPQADCGRARSLAVQVSFSSRNLSETLQTPSGVCGS